MQSIQQCLAGRGDATVGFDEEAGFWRTNGRVYGGYTVTGGRKEIMERGHRSAPLQGLSFRVSDPHSGTFLLSGHFGNVRSHTG